MGNVTLIRSVGWFIVGCLVTVVFLLLTGCGSYEPGSTDRTIDCIDGCNYDKDEWQGEQGEPGQRGATGARGPAGADGEDGIGRDGIDGQDGRDGEDGEDGQDAVLEIIDPCGDGQGFDEVLLRLSTGELVAYYTSGNRIEHLSIIGPGRYRTTDRQRCLFTVTQELDVVW